MAHVLKDSPVAPINIVAFLGRRRKPTMKSLNITSPERNTAVTHVLAKMFFLQKWKPLSVTHILTNPCKNCLNGFKDIRH